MLRTATHRPRNVDAVRAASILYGDLGTSKAYVIGLAFALVGYSSFWLIAAVSLLTIVIGLNYIIICKYYPNGGGVYASVRHRSRVISVIGAFFLVADYLVTAALSALSAFHYLGVSDPIVYSGIFIGVIGILNYFGPKHSGTFAVTISVCAIVVLTLLALVSIPYLPTALKNIQPLKGDSWVIWKHFVGVIVALSGIEAIANATGVMKLNPGSDEIKPIVTRISTPAIISVITEVAFYTSFFAFAAAAVTNFELADGTVNAPGNPNVRDYMLSYLGEVFAGGLFGTSVGHIFSLIISAVMGVLLLSAVNTAINGLVALQYIMAGDGDVPFSFQKINGFGVPLIPLFIATVIPIVLVLWMKDVAGLAALYAIGFVGAIATNLGSTSTDKRLDLKKYERLFMFVSFLIMAAVEITLFIDKPEARIYGLAVITVGLILWAISKEYREKKRKEIIPPVPERIAPPVPPPLPPQAILCVVTQPGKALDEALDQSIKFNFPLYLLYIREQEVISENDRFKKWEDDWQAVKLLNYAKQKARIDLLHFYYTVSDSASDILVAYAERLNVRQVIVTPPQRKGIRILKGNFIREVRRHLPEEIELSIVS